MRYVPSETELSSMESMSADERMHYFLSRTMESEEVWSLGDGSGWRIKDADGKEVIAVWPYKCMAESVAIAMNDVPKAEAVSLEQFVNNVLVLMAEHQLWVEVLPTPSRAGKVMPARELKSLFDSMMDSTEYFLEG